MKKIIIISSVIAAVALAALILALTLGGGNTGTAGTQATTGSTAETTGTGSTTVTQATAGTTAPPDCALTGRGHVYAGGVCGVCGACARCVLYRYTAHKNYGVRMHRYTFVLHRILLRRRNISRRAENRGGNGDGI